MVRDNDGDGDVVESSVCRWCALMMMLLLKEGCAGVHDTPRTCNDVQCSQE